MESKTTVALLLKFVNRGPSCFRLHRTFRHAVVNLESNLGNSLKGSRDEVLVA